MANFKSKKWECSLARASAYTSRTPPGVGTERGTVEYGIGWGYVWMGAGVARGVSSLECIVWGRGFMTPFNSMTPFQIIRAAR